MVGRVMKQHHITYLDMSRFLCDVVEITASKHHLIRDSLHFDDGLHVCYVNAEGRGILQALDLLWTLGCGIVELNEGFALAL